VVNLNADLVIKNAKIFSSKGFYTGGVAIAKGRIVAIGKTAILPKGEKIIDAKGKILIPGVIDEHCHIDEPWEAPDKEAAKKRENVERGTMAAAAGGVTTIMLMPDTFPLVTTEEAFLSKKEIYEKKAYVNFSLHAGFTPNMNYEEALPKLWALGATGLKTFTCFSIPEWPAIRDGELYAALKVISKIKALALIHAENDDILSYNRKILEKEGRKDYKAHLDWRPPIAEAEAVRRITFLLKEAKAKGMIVHTTIPEAIVTVKEAKRRGHQIYVESCPHYFYLTEEDVLKMGPWCKCAPPLRKKSYVAKLWEMLAKGYIDTIGSDHCGYSRDDKSVGEANIWNAPNGLPGIETMLPLMLNGVTTGRVSLETLISVLCENPAKIFGLYPKKGSIQIGSDADLALLDLKKEVKISNERILSNCGWTPFDGMVVKGYPVMTIVSGKVVMHDGEIVVSKGSGSFVPRLY
jgi:D-hydantoinase